MAITKHLYSSHINEHYHASRHKGKLVDPHFTAELANLSCGDKVTWSGHVKDGTIIACRFEAEGCILSQAAASLLAEYVTDKLVTDVVCCNAALMQKLIRIELGPMRLRCISLPLEALLGGLQTHVRSS
jgi:nitrogen fixation protein NifU and related proteins